MNHTEQQITITIPCLRPAWSNLALDNDQYKTLLSYNFMSKMSTSSSVSCFVPDSPLPNKKHHKVIKKGRHKFINILAPTINRKLLLIWSHKLNGINFCSTFTLHPVSRCFQPGHVGSIRMPINLLKIVQSVIKIPIYYGSSMPRIVNATSD